MTWVATAIAAGSVIGGYVSSQGAQGAAQTQANSAANAQAISQNEFNTITGQEQPYMQGGYNAMGALEYGLGLPGSVPAAPGQSSNGYQSLAGGGSFTLGPGNTGTGTTGFGSLLAPFTAATMKQYSPAYNFQLQQGMQGVLNGDANTQGALSGAAQKDLMSFNQNYANTAFNNAFNQYQTQQGNIYQRLAGLTQLGQSAAANTGQQGTALAGQAAQSATNIGTALGAGQVGAANAWSGALSNASYLPFLMNLNGGSLGSAGAGGQSGMGFSGLSGY